MQIAVLAPAICWLASGELLWFGVGAVGFLLARLPAMLVDDGVLRSASSLCVTALVAAHVILGMKAGLYETSTVYDKLAHTLGSGVVTGVLITAVSRYAERERLSLPLPFFFILVLGAGVSLGTFWEIFEFAADKSGLFYAQRGLSDTMLDLIANLVGTLFTLALYAGLARGPGLAIWQRSA